MNRSTIIAGALLGGFVLYIAAKGDFGQYLSLMTPSLDQSTGPATLDSGGVPSSGSSPSFLPSSASGTTGGATFPQSGFAPGYGLPAAGGSGFGLPGLGF